MTTEDTTLGLTDDQIDQLLAATDNAPHRSEGECVMGDSKFGSRALPERFWAKVQPDASGCWLWIGAKQSQGYGQIKTDGRTWLTHRVAYAAMVGPVGEGLELDHACQTRTCTNPDHLRPVTHRENMQRLLPRHNGTSAFRGVSWYRRDRKWRACVNIDGRLKHLGYFTSEWDAAVAAHEARLAAGYLSEADDWAGITEAVAS